MNGINLSNITLRFCQEGNTNGTTNETEELDIILESKITKVS